MQISSRHVKLQSVGIDKLHILALLLKIIFGTPFVNSRHFSIEVFFVLGCADP